MSEATTIKCDCCEQDKPEHEFGTLLNATKDSPLQDVCFECLSKYDGMFRREDPETDEEEGWYLA